jgi:rhodanese-related sulfurtransferase
LAVDEPVYDFGEVVDGVVVEHAFVLTNVGDAPLLFTRDPLPTCGCTSAPLPRRQLAPGESMELVVLFDSTRYGGRRVAETVSVYTDDPEARELRLTVRGYVRRAAPHEASASTLYYRYYLLLDVRDPDAFARGHLLGAVNVPLPGLLQWLDRFPREFLVYVYDEAGERAAQAAAQLAEAGFLARFMAGGLLGWRQAFGDLFWIGDVATLPTEGAPYVGDHEVSPARIAQSYLVLLDLRDPGTYAQGHLPGAINLRPEEAKAWAEGLPAPDGLPAGVAFAVWCLDEDGATASAVAQELRAAGHDAYAMIGGLAQWRLLYGESLLRAAFWGSSPGP